MVKITFGMMGSSASGGSSKMATAEQLEEILALLNRYRVRELDTARAYNGGQSEKLLGQVEAAKAFEISTKVPGFVPGSLTAEKITESCQASLEALQQEQVDIMYFHGPDRKTPLEVQCKAFDALYRKGAFRRFGMCNISVEEIRAIYDICKTNGYVLPTVHQGGYNALARGGEEAGLFTTLRELGIAFYAYSPLAGGFFSKTVDELRNPAKGGRFEAMKVFKDIYVNETSLGALESLTQTCVSHGITPAQAALRWLMHHSALGGEDAVILGASSLQQAQENLEACQGGPLPDVIVESIESMWPAFKKVSGARYHV